MAIPLHVHSQYSILESTISVQALAKRAKELGLSSIALTDRGNLFGAVDFYKNCIKQGIKPIIGCELWLAPGDCREKKKQPGMPAAFSYLFLAQNEIGYRNLCKLSSIGYLDGFYYVPRIDKRVLETHSEGLICLSGGYTSFLYYLVKQEQQEKLEEEVNWLTNLFGDRFYLQIQRQKKMEAPSESWLEKKYTEHLHAQERLNQSLIALSQKNSLPIVAAQEAFYLHAVDWRSHEILLNVQSGQPCEVWELDSRGNKKAKVPNPKRSVLPGRSFYLMSPEEMKETFSDLPQALQMSQDIADRCDLSLDFKTKHYPVYVAPSLEGKAYTPEEREKEAEKYLLQLCEEGIKTRYTEEALEKVGEKYPGQDPLQVVKDRLAHEFHIITSKGMCDYLLIVYDFIAWSKHHKIPVGPGRGSAAGSILCYLIGITDIEPLRFHLFFERFINPERVSYPDIDVDICMHRREEVIDYTIGKYGKDKVAQIITFGTMKAKMAIKDVGRVLNVPLGKVNEIAKLVPEDLNITLDKALDIDPDLKNYYNTDQEAKTVIDIARSLEGSVRNTSIHAAGLIISADAITEHIPVCVAKDAQMIVTQFAMKPVEAVGMLKIDFLGLTTLTSIQLCVDMIKETEGAALDWTRLPLDDSNTYALLNHGKTSGVFQVESAGMRDLLKQLHIDHFEEIIAVGALYRPGPMDMIPSFIQRKHGQEEIDFDHPLMKDILQETYGVMVYQEQVMQIASKLAGYSLGEGDVLRRAMGKKDHEEMNRQREKFVKGCQNNDIDQAVAETIFNKIEKFASYGFNKSHATAYAYLTYTTAFMKANYPKQWMAALMTCAKDDLTKISKYVQEAKSLGIEILPPDVCEAGVSFVPVKEGIRFAMSGVKGIGQSVVEAIVAERKKEPFQGMYDFMQRVPCEKIGRKSIEILVLCGGFDFTGWPRDALLQFIDQYYDIAVKEQKEKRQGILDLFAGITTQSPDEKGPPQVITPISQVELFHKEKELLGFYLTGHPMDSYTETLQKLSCKSLKDLEDDKASWVLSAFIIESLAFKISPKTQRKFAIALISDGYASYEIPIWSDLYEANIGILEEKNLFVGIFQLDRKQGDLKLFLRDLALLSELDSEKMIELNERLETLKKRKRSMNTAKKMEKKHLKIILKGEVTRLSHIVSLKDLFRKYPGPTTIELFFKEEGKIRGVIDIPQQWGVSDHENFLHALQMFSFISQVELEKIEEAKG
jgi:DNA polymerase III subunit alpha